MRLLEGWVEHRSTAILCGFALAGVLLAGLAVRVEVAPGLDELLLDSDPELARNEEVRLDFSNDEILVVGYDLGDDKLDHGTLQMLERFRLEIESLPEVDEVIDLTNVEDVRARATDPTFVDASPLVSDGVENADIEALRARIRGHRLYEGSLVSADLGAVATVIVPRIAGEGTPFPSQAKLNESLVQRVYDLASGVDVPVWVAGYPAAEHESTTIVLRDLIVLTTIAVVLVLALLWLFVRKVWALGLLVVVIAWTELVAIAWLGLSGTPLNVVLSTMPTVLLATSSTYALYMIQLLAAVPEDEAPGVGLLRLCARSCMLSAFSTGAGFLALLVMPVPSIRSLGLSLAVGILGCLCASLLLLPALVQRFELRIDTLPFAGLGGLTVRGISWARHPWRTLAIAAPLVALAAAGMARLEIESDPLTFWKPDHYHRQSDRFLQENLGGSLFLHAVISTGMPDGALQPHVMRFARQWLRSAETSPIVTRSLSLLDYFALMDDVLDPERERSYFSDEALAMQYMVLYENAGDPDDLRHYIDFDRSALNLVLRVNSRSSSEILALRDRLLDVTPPAGVDTEVLGTWLLFPKAMDAIAHGMVRGLLVAVAAIFVAMLLVLRSARLAALAMIPNTLPILVCLGILGWLGVPLSFATAIVGCVALGLAVDDTAHVLGHLAPGRSLEEVFHRVGRALLVTTASLGTGFLALGFSGFLPLVHFGHATTLSLLVAFAADVLLLPSLLCLAGAGEPTPSRANETASPALANQALS